MTVLKDCSRLCGIVVGKSILYGIPMRLLWPLMLILCGGRVLHFIAFER